MTGYPSDTPKALRPPIPLSGSEPDLPPQDPSSGDIDPATSVPEEDEEARLPEVSEEAGEAVAEGPLAVGHAAIEHAVRHAPVSPGVYRMLNAANDVLYVGKAKNVRKRLSSYARVAAPQPPRILRMIAATVTVEIVSTSTETEALLLEANLIKQLKPRFNVQLRDDKSFPYILITGDHWAPQILNHRGAAARVFDPLLHRRLFRKPHPPLPALPDPPLRRPLHPRDRFPRLYRAGARGHRLPVRPQPSGEAGARGRDGKGLRRARIRDRSTLSRPPRRAVGDPVAAGHQSAHGGGGRRVRHPSGRRLFLRRGVLLPHRTELGQPRLFSARGEILHAGRGAVLVPGAVLRRQAAAKTRPAVARHRGVRTLGGRAVGEGRPQGRSFRSQARREEGNDRACADQCARGARPQARRYRDPKPAPGGACDHASTAAFAQADRGLRQQPHPGHQRG